MRNRFRPERLKEAREIRGYTMVDLANALNISRQAISQFEKGTAKPNMANLIRISSILNVPLYYFLRDRASSSSRTSPIYFRRFNTATKKHRVQAIRYEEWITYIFEFLNNYLNFPKPNLIQSNIDFTKLTNDQIEEIALQLRRHWMLSDRPISNITMLLENNGIIIGHKNLSGKLDSFSCWHCDRPNVVLTNNNRSAVRTRNSAMHEIGHLVLHRDVTDEELENARWHKLIENQANRFASAFLMPITTFTNDFISTSEDALRILKRRWLVSMKAIVRRASDLRLINESQLINAYKKLSPYRKKEPLDDDIPMEKPVLLSRGINMLINDGFITRPQLLDELNLPIKDIIELTCLDSNYFDVESEENVVNIKMKEVYDS